MSAGTEKGPLDGDTEGTIRQPSWSIRGEEVPSQRGTLGTAKAGFHSATETNVPWLQTNTRLNLTDWTQSQKREFPENARDVTVGDTHSGYPRVQASSEAPRGGHTWGPGAGWCGPRGCRGYL